MSLLDGSYTKVETAGATRSVADKTFTIAFDPVANRNKSLWCGWKPGGSLPWIDHTRPLLMQFKKTSFADIPTASIIPKEDTNPVAITLWKVQRGVLECHLSCSKRVM